MRAKYRWNIVAGLYGNALEWFDFILYASLAPLLATLFFPSKDVFLSLLGTFGVFAIGFAARPIGGFILGYYSDSIGRRKALIAALCVMSATSLLIGLLPTFGTVGKLAPLLLTLLRILQGLAIGGELPSSTTYLVELLPAKRRSLAGSLTMSVAFLGILFGVLTATVLSAVLSQENLEIYGWRLGFVIGALFGVLGIYFRLKSSESEVFLQEKNALVHPFRELMKHYKLKLFIGIAFTSVLALANYLLIAFVPSYLVKLKGYSLEQASQISFIALFLVTVMIPLGGILADKFGRKSVFLFGVIGLVVFGFVIFWMLQQKSFSTVLLSQLLLGFWLGPINGTLPTILSEMFITPIRNSGISFCYNIGQSIFGGTAPLIAFLLIDVTHTLYSIPVYLTVCAVFALFAAALYQKSCSQQHI